MTRSVVARDHVILTPSEADHYGAGVAHGYVRGYRDGRADLEGELAAEWESIKPIARRTVVLTDMAAVRERQARLTAAYAAEAPPWDPAAARDRCARSFGAASYADLVAEAAGHQRQVAANA